MGLHKIEVKKRKILMLKMIKKEDEIKWRAHKMPTPRILEFVIWVSICFWMVQMPVENQYTTHSMLNILLMYSCWKGMVKH
jgi:hypothetical protein